MPVIKGCGNWIAFASDRAGTWDIWVIPPAGGDAIQITDWPDLGGYNGGETGPVWSPDGTALAFVSSAGSSDSPNMDIWIAENVLETVPAHSKPWGAIKKLFK